jgi:hypothetical protein
VTVTVDDRHAFVQELKDDPRVEDLDFTRDGYRTVVLQLRHSAGESR